METQNKRELLEAYVFGGLGLLRGIYEVCIKQELQYRLGRFAVQEQDSDS